MSHIDSEHRCACIVQSDILSHVKCLQQYLEGMYVVCGHVINHVSQSQVA